MKRVIWALILFSVSAAANAYTVRLIAHNQTSGGGTITTLITDGSHISGIAGGSTALWDWDGTTLSSTGLYSNVSSISSSPITSTILSDQITNLSINLSTGTASATSYSCLEGTFLAVVGANGCGGYTFGTNTVDDSTTIWGPGTAVSQTLGGDDVSTRTPRSISQYDFGFSSSVVITAFSEEFGGYLDWTTVVIGNGIALGSVPGGQWMCFASTFAISDGPQLPSCDEAIQLAIAPVPVPAAFWLFGSALSLLGWRRRKTN